MLEECLVEGMADGEAVVVPAVGPRVGARAWDTTVEATDRDLLTSEGLDGVTRVDEVREEQYACETYLRSIVALRDNEMKLSVKDELDNRFSDCSQRGHA